MDSAFIQSPNPSHNDQNLYPQCFQTGLRLSKSPPVFGAKAYSHRDALDSTAHSRHRIMHAHTGEPQPFANEARYHRVS